MAVIEMITAHLMIITPVHTMVARMREGTTMMDIRGLSATTGSKMLIEKRETMREKNSASRVDQV